MIKYIAPAPADSNRFGGRESNPTFTLIFSLQLLSVYQFRHLTIYALPCSKAITQELVIGPTIYQGEGRRSTLIR